MEGMFMPQMKKKPGRPKKTETATTQTTVKKKPGRPKKSTTGTVKQATTATKKKAGRPKKTDQSATKKSATAVVGKKTVKEQVQSIEETVNFLQKELSELKKAL